MNIKQKLYFNGDFIMKKICLVLILVLITFTISCSSNEGDFDTGNPVANEALNDALNQLGGADAVAGFTKYSRIYEDGGDESVDVYDIFYVNDSITELKEIMTAIGSGSIDGVVYDNEVLNSFVIVNELEKQTMPTIYNGSSETTVDVPSGYNLYKRTITTFLTWATTKAGGSGEWESETGGTSYYLIKITDDEMYYVYVDYNNNKYSIYDDLDNLSDSRIYTKD